MKRNDMVYAIAKAIYENNRNELMPTWEDAPSSYARGHLNDANTALITIEKVGMLPPPIPGVYDNVPSLTPTGNLDYSFKRGWEEE